MNRIGDKGKWSVTLSGLSAAWPICVGYVPIGLAFGVLAEKVGLNPFEIALMSLFVFAGSAQFIAISMLSSGAAPIPIIFTTFMVNLRHLLMSSSLAIYMTKIKRRTLSIFAYGITDESFAVNLARFRDGNWGIKQALVVNHVSNFIWVLSTIAGGYGGRFIPEKAFGIDYALIAMFICLLVFQLRGAKYLITALFSGTLAVIISLIIPGNSYIIIASVLAATLGMAFKKHLR